MILRFCRLSEHFKYSLIFKMMPTLVGPRERAIFSNSLATLLLGVVGHSAVVELKNECQIRGKVVIVDCFTNVTMENAVMTRLEGTQSCFSMIFIPMKSIRSVQLPDYLSVQETLKDQVGIITGEKFREERRQAKLKLEKQRANRKRKQEEKRAEKLARQIQQ